MKKLILPLCLILVTQLTFSQDKLDVQGDGVITGNLNLGTGSNLVIGNGGTNLTTGCCSVVIGRDAGLIHNSNSNVIIGHLAGNTSNATQSVYIGQSAGKVDATGAANTFIGSPSGLTHTSGQDNTFIGRSSGQGDTMSNNTVLLGSFAGVTAPGGAVFNGVALGVGATVNANDKVRIGNSATTVIEGQVAYSFPSDGRFKTNVKDDVAGLELIMKLRPVTYNFDLETYNNHIRPEGFKSGMSKEMIDAEKAAVERSKELIQTGFIAQEVEAAAKSIDYDFDAVVAPQNERDNYSLRYSTFVVPLVKAVQEQQNYISDLENTVASQEERLAQLEQQNSTVLGELVQLKAMLNTMLGQTHEDGVKIATDD